MIKFRYSTTRWLLSLLALCCWMLAEPAASTAATGQQNQLLVQHEIRYTSTEAGEVALVWGVNGWHMLSEAIWPAGTTIVKTTSDLMHTPMVWEDGAFVARVQVPAGATIDYIFQISRTRSGIAAAAWDMNGHPEQDFHTVASSSVTEIAATTGLAQQIFSTEDATVLQWYGLVVLSVVVVLLGLLALRLQAQNPYVDM